MATYTITTPVNIDSLAAKVGSDVYNINGGALTIDQDTRFGINQNVSAALGNITLSPTLGGSLLVDGRKVRLIPFNTGSGLVPAYGTTISRGGASAVLLGVYSALNVAPTAPGGAMPTSGFIKVRQWNSTPYTAGALTGISASATGADVAGWLEIVGVDALTNTLNRLNDVKYLGEWYEFLGATTDGTRATTYQIPSNGAIVYMAGVWVETGTGTGQYEWYPCAGNLTALAANIATDAIRGKYCWISTAGLLRFGHDGTNSTGGYIPPAGRKIRIGNVFLACCTAAALTANVLPNATLATRYEFATTGGGVLQMDKVMSNWYMNLNQPFSLALTNLGILTNLTATEIATPIAWSNVNIGQEAGNTQIGLLFNLNFAGGTMSNCKFARRDQAASGAYVSSLTDINGFIFTNCQFNSLVKAANATAGSVNLVRGVDCIFEGTVLGGGRFFETTCTRVNVNNSIYYDHPAVNTLAAIPMYAFDIGSNCLECNFEGLSFGGLHLTQPYNGIINVGAAGCAEIYLKNVGTFASPLSLGKARIDGAAWTRVTTVATVTETAHPYLVNDTIYVDVSDSTGAIVVGLKTITAVTANTFSFVCLNAGAASGVLSYHGAKAGQLFALAASSAVNGFYVQRVYTPDTRVTLFTADNSAKNVVLENVLSDYVSASLFSILNFKAKGIYGTHPLTAQTSIYGTHWFDTFVSGVASNTASQAYTRATTTVTVTSANHRLRTGMIITVDPSVAPTTFTAALYSVTVLTPSTFTITVANAGAASGNLTYRVANGRIGLSMNETTADTISQYTVNAGAPAFTSAGGLYMPAIGDSVTFTMPDYLIGHGATFPLFEPLMAGGTLANYDIFYELDKNDGAGYLPIQNLYFSRVTGGGTIATTTVTMADTTGVAVDDYLFGTGIAIGAKVSSIDSPTDITVSIANVGAVSGVLRFGHLASETGLNPQEGFKMKWTITTRLANTTAISSLYIQDESTAASRAYQYPLTVANATFSFSGLEIGTEVVLFNSANVEITRQVIVGTTYGYPYQWNSNDGDITGAYALIWKNNRFPIKFTGISLTANNLNVPISQSLDFVYETAGTVTPLTIDYASKLIIMDSGTVELHVPEMYSKWKDNILLTNNAQYDFAFTQVGGNEIVSPKFIPKYAFQANGWKVRTQEADHTLNVTSGILVGESGSDPFVNTLSPFTVRINYEQPVQAITVNTAGGGGGDAPTPLEIHNEFVSQGHFARASQVDSAEVAIQANIDSIDDLIAAIPNDVWSEELSTYAVGGQAGNTLHVDVVKVDDLAGLATGGDVTSARDTIISNDNAIGASVISEIQSQTDDVQTDIAGLVPAIRADIERSGGMLEKTKNEATLAKALSA